MKRVKDTGRMGVYVASKDVIGNTLGFDVAISMSSKITKQAGFASLAKTNWVLETWGGTNRDLQNEVAAFLFPNQIHRIEPLLSDGVNTIVFSPQVLVLIKLLILNGIDDSTIVDLSPENVNRVGLALLGITDGIARQYRFTKSEFEDLDDLTRITYELATTSFFMTNPRIGLSLTRATHLFINIHDKLTAKKPQDYVDIHEIFLKATGLNLTEYLSFGIGLLVHYLPNWKVGMYPKDRNFIYFVPRTLFAKAKIEFSKIDSIVAAISKTPDDFKKVLSGQNKRELLHDFIAFRGHPLLEIHKDLFVPISVFDLLDKVTMGVYWIIFDYLKNNEPSEHQKFMSYMGKVFQDYVEDLSNAILTRSLDEVVFPDYEYRTKKGLVRSPDVVVFGEDYILLIEASATRMQARRTVALGDTKAFLDDFDKMIMHNARSLSRYVNDLRAGIGIPEGMNIEGKRIFPIIVTIEAFIPMPLINPYLQEQIKKENIFENGESSQLSIMSIEELEELEGHANLTLITALREWLKAGGLKYDNFGSFLKVQHAGDEFKSPWLNKIQRQIFNEATKLFFDTELGDQAAQAR